MAPDRILTAPNILSFFRILLIPVFLALMVRGRPSSAFLVFLLAASTDFFDGILARMWHQKSRLGAYLDPAADKLLMSASFVILSLPGLNFSNSIPLWLTLSVVGRDVLIVLGVGILYKWKGEKNFTPTLTGKASTACQMGVLLLVLFYNMLQASPAWLSGLYVLTMGLTLLSFFHYGLIAGRRITGHLNRSRRVKD